MTIFLVIVGKVVVGELPDTNNIRNIGIGNNSEITYNNCQLSFSGPGVDAFSHAGVIYNQSPANCLSSIAPMSYCGVQLAPMPTIVGDQEVSVVLSCDEDTVYYLENTSKVTGVYPLEYQGAPFYGKMNNAQDGYWTEIKFRNIGQALLDNCQVSLSNNIDFHITDLKPDGSSITAGETCGLPGNIRSSMSTYDECKIGLIPKAGAVGKIYTDVNVFCNGNLSGSFAYEAERTSNTLGDFITNQDNPNFENVEIPYHGDGEEQERWVLIRNNSGKNLYGCHVEAVNSSGPDAINAMYIKQAHCEPGLKHGEACYFKVVPSRFPWEGLGALQVGSHSSTSRLSCDDFSSTVPIVSPTGTTNITVTDNDAAMKLVPNFYNFGNVAANETASSITIQVTNTSGSLLTNCDPPEFYSDGNQATEFNITNNNCPLDFPAGASCSFDLSYTSYTDDGSQTEKSAEMEIRCDNQKYVRTGSNFVANYNQQGGDNVLHAYKIIEFENHSTVQTGETLKVYVYPFGKIAVQSGSPKFTATLSDGTTTVDFNYVQADSTDHRLAFQYTVDQSVSHSGPLVLSFDQGGAIFYHPDTNTNFTTPNFYWYGIDSRIIYINQTAPPRIVSVTSQNANGTYYTGDQIKIDVQYSESVKVDPTYKTTAETGSINCLNGSNSATGSGDPFSNIEQGDSILVSGSGGTDEEYIVASKINNNSLTFTTNCTDNYNSAPFFLKENPPTLSLTNNSSQYGLGLYDPNVDINDTDDIVTFSFIVGPNFFGEGLNLLSDGQVVSDGIFSVANSTLPATGMYGCGELPLESCLDHNASFNFQTRPAITSINYTGNTTLNPGDLVTFTLVFSESVLVANPDYVKLKFKSDDGLQYSYATLDLLSNNGDQQLSFIWEVPQDFFAADLDIFDYISFNDNISALPGGVSVGRSIAPIYPKGAEANSLKSIHDIKVTRGAPKVINVTSSEPLSQNYQSGEYFSFKLEFSESIELKSGTSLGNISITLKNEIPGGTHMQANATDIVGNEITFSAPLITNFYSKDLKIYQVNGLNNIQSIESKLEASSNIPIGPDINGSLSNNYDYEVGLLPLVTSVSTTANSSNPISAVDDILEVMVTFNQAVTVVGGTPQLKVLYDDGSASFDLSYDRINNGNQVIFKGTANLSDISEINTQDLTISELFLNSATIKSSSNNITYSEANSFGENFPIGADSRSLSSNEDIVMGTAPSISYIDLNSAYFDGVSNFYTQGDALVIEVYFSAAMEIVGGMSGNVKLVFNDDSGSPVYATYASGNNPFKFNFSVPSNMNTADLELINFVGLEYVHKAGESSNFVSLNVPKGDDSPNSLKSKADIVIGSAPQLRENVNLTVNNSPYILGDTLTISANFNQGISLAPAAVGAVKLEFKDNNNNSVYAYLDEAPLTPPSFSQQVTFTMVVPANMNTTDLQVFAVHGIGNLVAEKSKIPIPTSAFPVQGATNSLSASLDIVVGGPAPKITSMTGTDGTYFSGDSVSLNVAFDVPVSVDATDVGLVKLELTDDNGAIAYAILATSVTNVSLASFNFEVPLQNFTATDLTVTNFIGAEHVYNHASAIPLDLTDAPLNDAANSLKQNQVIVIQEIPRIESFTVISAPANGSYYQAPTQSADLLKIAVNFTKEVEVDSGNESYIKLRIKNQDGSQTADGSIISTSLSDTNQNQIVFEFDFDQNFHSTDVDVDSIQNINLIEIPQTSTSVSATFPVGQMLGSLKENSDIEVRNDIKVTNITSDVADGLYPDNSLHVRVQFSSPITVNQSDLGFVSIRANGENGTFVIAHIDENDAYQNTNELSFRFDFPDQFQTPELMINFVGGFDKIKRPDNTAANIVNVPINGVPNSLAANKDIEIEQKDPMTRYGSGVDGHISISTNIPIDLSLEENLVKDKDNQPKYPISYFKVRGIQYFTTPHPHHVITIQPGDAVNYRAFQQADGTAQTITTIEQNDVVMWYVNSERGNACGNNLAPGMFGFLVAENFISATQARFKTPPGVDVSIMGGAIFPASGLPPQTTLEVNGFSTVLSEEVPNHCNIQLVRVFMPHVLQISNNSNISSDSYNVDYGTGGVLPIKVKEVLDLIGSTSTIDMTGRGFPSVSTSNSGFTGFSGHSGWSSQNSSIVVQSGGQGDSSSQTGGGGAGWGDGGNYSGNSNSGGISPVITHCNSDCYPQADFNKVKFAFMGSAGAEKPDKSIGGGVIILHAKKIENGTLIVKSSGDSTTGGGGSGGGTIYMDFQTVNQFGDNTSDVSFYLEAKGSDSQSGSSSGGGGGGHINIQVCNNNNNTNSNNHPAFVTGGSGAEAGDNGLKVIGSLDMGTHNCLNDLPVSN